MTIRVSENVFIHFNLSLSVLFLNDSEEYKVRDMTHNKYVILIGFFSYNNIDQLSYLFTRRHYTERITEFHLIDPLDRKHELKQTKGLWSKFRKFLQWKSFVSQYLISVTSKLSHFNCFRIFTPVLFLHNSRPRKLTVPVDRKEKMECNLRRSFNPTRTEMTPINLLLCFPWKFSFYVHTVT